MVKIVGGKELEAVAAASVPNNSIFIDSADNLLKFKNNSGGITPVIEDVLAGSVIYTSQTSIAITATLIKASTADRVGAILANQGTDTIYLGTTSGVTTATGYPLKPSEFLQVYGTSAIYGIVGTTASTAHLFEVRA